MRTSKTKSKPEKKKVYTGIFEKVPGSDVWWIRLNDRPYHVHREKAGTRSQAKQLLAIRKAAVLQGQKFPPARRGRPTFADLADDFLAFSKAWPQKSWRTNASRIPLLKEKFGSRIAEDIVPAEITTWLGEHGEWALATRNRYLALAKRIYSYAEDESKKITSNPVRRMKVKGENNKRERFLNQFPPLPARKSYLKPHTNEEARLRAVIRRKYPRHLPEFEIALHTGLRPSEQFGLLWTNVDLVRRIVTVAESKHGKARRVPLNDTALAAFENLRRRKNNSNYVFVSEREKQDPVLRSARHWFNHAVLEAGLREIPDNQGTPRRFRFYDLRHSHGTRLIERGVSISMVRDLMGHRNIKTTDRYLHSKNEDGLAAVRMLDEPRPEALRLSLVKNKERSA